MEDSVTDASARDAGAGDPSAKTQSAEALGVGGASAEALAWYAVHTRAQKEAYADLHLRRQGFTTFFPFVSEWVGLGTKRARLKKRAWLARYLFVAAAPHLFFRVNETPGVASLVHAPGQMPLPVPAKIMAALQERADPPGRSIAPARASGNFKARPAIASASARAARSGGSTARSSASWGRRWWSSSSARCWASGRPACHHPHRRSPEGRRKRGWPGQARP